MYPSDFRLFMYDGAADAKMSASAPCSICVSRFGLLSKVHATVTPGCATSYRADKFVKTSFNAPAAKTLISVAGTAVGEGVAEVSVEEHPATSTAQTAISKIADIKTIFDLMISLYKG
jgi:hypothetical protein